MNGWTKRMGIVVAAMSLTFACTKSADQNGTQTTSGGAETTSPSGTGTDPGTRTGTGTGAESPTIGSPDDGTGGTGTEYEPGSTGMGEGMDKDKKPDAGMR